MSGTELDVESSDENDNVVLLRSAYRALARLQTNLDNLDACLKKGDTAAVNHLAIAKANAKEALDLVTRVGKSTSDQ